jgi:choline dehydrogenase
MKVSLPVSSASGWLPLTVAALLCTRFASAQEESQDAVNANTYDYIVIGSGPGGGPVAANLARQQHSVLLLEAGDDQSSNYNSEIPVFFSNAFVDPTMRWDFFVKNYADVNRTLQHNKLTWRKPDGTFYVGTNPPAGSTMLGLYYPRGATLGGSSSVNAMGTVLPSDSDWQNIVDLTGDSAWR